MQELCLLDIGAARICCGSPPLAHSTVSRIWGGDPRLGASSRFAHFLQPIHTKVLLKQKRFMKDTFAVVDHDHTEVGTDLFAYLQLQCRFQQASELLPLSFSLL